MCGVRADTSCRIIDDWTGSIELDAAEVEYYNLVPPSVRPPGVGPKERMMLDNAYANEYIQYSAQAFPSFCGQSATFSLWVETDTLDGGYYLSRYATSDKVKPARWWALYGEAYGLYVYGFNAPSQADLPTGWGRPLEHMKPISRRHLAFVFDKVCFVAMHLLHQSQSLCKCQRKKERTDVRKRLAY